jgi:MFS family permease
MMIASCSLFTLWSPETTTAARIGYLCLLGVGAGILFPALQLCCQASQPDEDVAIATSTFVFIRSLGQTFGVALGGVIFQNQWDKNLAILISTYDIPTIYQIPGSQAEHAILELPQLPFEMRELARWLYSDSLRAVWICFVPLSIIAFIASLFVRNYSLNKELKSKQSFEETRAVVERSDV